MYYFVEEKAKKIPPHKKYFFKIRKYIGAALGLHDGGLFHFVSEKRLYRCTVGSLYLLITRLFAPGGKSGSSYVAVCSLPLPCRVCSRVFTAATLTYV